MQKEREELSSDYQYKREAAKVVADQKRDVYNRQALLTKSLTGGQSTTINDGKQSVDKFVEFFTTFSNTALKGWQSQQQALKEGDEAEGIAAASYFPMTNEALGASEEFKNLQIMSATNDEMAAFAQATGVPDDEVDKIRGGSQWRSMALKKALADRAGNTYSQEFLKLAPTSDAEVSVMRNGKLETVPLKEINLSDPNEVNLAMRGYLRQYYNAKGFGDADTSFLADSLVKADEQIISTVGGLRTQQISNNKATRLDESKQLFNLNPGVQPFRDYYQSQYTDHNIGDSAKSRAEALELLKDPFTVPENVLDAIGDAPLAAGQKPLREQYPGEWLSLIHI